MGLIHAALGAAGGVLADQWKEYFYCEAMDSNTLAVKGKKKVSGRSSNTHGDDNIITSGSVIVVADGQCMLIVEEGKVVDLCAEPGEYTYDASTEPSIFAGGGLASNIKEVLANIGKRFTFGGEAPKDQRVYYFNTKEITGNKYGTPAPIPFRIVDENIGLKMAINISCFGEYSYRITNPALLYTNITGNFSSVYTRDNLESQMKTELLTALQPAFGEISAQGINYDELPSHTLELSRSLNEILSKEWRDLRGIEIVSFGVSSVKAKEEDEERLKELQTATAYSNPNYANAQLARATAEALTNASKNEGAGGAMAFMGMNMAGMMGANAGQVYGTAGQAPAQPAADSWVCPKCGATSTGNFCSACGEKKPVVNSWKCPKCGAENTGNFCSSCGEKRPENNTWVCPKCGVENSGNFCSACGEKKPE